MKSLVSKMQTAMLKRVAYNTTVNELSKMSIDTALDLNIYHGDIRRIARQAVYG